jgi:hypothetical protein
VEVRYEIRPPDPKDPKAKGEAPRVEVTIIGAPSVAADKLVLVDTAAKPPVRITALAKRSYAQGNEPLALAVVMFGWEQWIGNDTYRPKNDPTRVKGVLAPLRSGLDKLDFKALAPPGSLAMVITYAQTAQIRQPLGPLEALTGAALGTQKDYANSYGTELVKGIELALAELRKAATPVKALIILTDGNDTDNDTARQRLAVLKKQAQADRVQVGTIVYKAADSASGNVLLPLFPRSTTTVTTADDVAPSILKLLQGIGDRQYATFPGYHRDTKRGLLWDGNAEVGTRGRRPAREALTSRYGRGSTVPRLAIGGGFTALRTRAMWNWTVPPLW